MQGNLSDIDARSLLQLLEFNQRTGELFVETGDGRYWSLFFLKGRLVYATGGSGAMERFQECAARFNLTEAFITAQGNSTQNGSARPAAMVPASAPEYGVLCAMVEERKLSLAQAQQLIRLATEEIVFDLMSLRAGAFIFEVTTGISPALIAIETAKLVAEVGRRLDEWQKLRPLVQSGEQRPRILNHRSLQQQLPAPVYTQLSQTMNGERSLRVLARILGRDMVTVARALVPYIHQGMLGLEGTPADLSAPVSEQTRPARLACIDDSLSIQKSIEFCLQGRGYDFKAISSPLAAINELFSFKPDLILLDIAMPRLDGYELCGMLRKSNLFRQTPVIMLTGRDSYVDRVRARMAGATEYLTKPFGERELLDLVDRFIGSRTTFLISPRI